MPAAAGWDPAKELKVEPAKNPLPNGTLGDIGLGAAVGGLDEFPLTILVFPLDAREAVGIDRGSIRVFRWDAETRALKPLWNSGTNLTLGFIWAKIRRPGTYVPLGLPRDTLLNEALESLAYERQATDVDSPRERHVLTRNALRLFTEVPPEPLEELRAFLVGVESLAGGRQAWPGRAFSDVPAPQG